ncbi:hypothetical protein [Nonomuraea sp. NPDC050643]|uniref:hypothetical protein n=1 Tax=Nonomuraea sp. NPDC050643 TaxID=3155660 RepID=UPI0033C344DF
MDDLTNDAAHWHPQTGEVWPCEARAADVWMHLAFDDERRLMPAAARMPAGVRREGPPRLVNRPVLAS